MQCLFSEGPPMSGQSEREAVERFLHLCEKGGTASLADFGKQRISFFRAVLEAVAALPPDLERDSCICKNIISLLAEAKRFFDIASLYAAAKKRHGGERQLDAVFRRALLPSIHEIFVATLTYHSPELDTLFCEALGDDRERFLEILGSLFEKRRLYTLRLSPAIQHFFYTVADENVRHFVLHANVHFLAFYLAMLRDLPRRNENHLDKWVSLLLSPTTNRDIVEKVLEAMRINPVGEFLIILLLISRDDQRSTVLHLLRSLLERRPYLFREQRGTIALVLDRVFASHFYDIHRIPRDQKAALANLVLFTEHPTPLERMYLLLREPNPLRDPKRIDTKKICAATLVRFGEKNPRYLANVRGLLRYESLEDGVRQEILFLLQNHASESEKQALASSSFLEPNGDEERTVVVKRPE